MSSRGQAESRLILHVDLDAFYAAVEHRRLAIPLSQPLVVAQWVGIIAVGYAAKKAGVQRFMTVKQALAKCPQLHVVQIDTVKHDGEDEDEGEGNLVDAVAVRAQTDGSGRKLRLTRFRAASDEVLAVLEHWCAREHAVLEKASIDEAYIDVTQAVARRLQQQQQQQQQQQGQGDGAGGGAGEGGSAAEDGHAGEQETLSGFGYSLDYSQSPPPQQQQGGSRAGGAAAAQGGVASGHAEGFVLGENGHCLPLAAGIDAFVAAASAPTAGAGIGGGVAEAAATARRLLAAAELCAGLRARVRAETGFTMSGGVAHNKAVAKLASARNKPDRLTVVPRGAAAALLRSLPLGELPGLGGKLGSVVEAAIRRACTGAAAPCAAATATAAALTLGTLHATLQQQRQRQQQQQRPVAAALRAQLCASEHDGGLGPAAGAKQADRLLGFCHGDDNRPVHASVVPRSFASSRSFVALRTRGDVARWLPLLAAELRDDRMTADVRRWRRRPTNLSLTVRLSTGGGVAGAMQHTGTRTSSCAVPAGRRGADDGLPTTEQLVEAALALFDKLGVQQRQITRMALGVSQFAPLPSAGGSAGALHALFAKAPKRARSDSGGGSSSSNSSSSSSSSSNSGGGGGSGSSGSHISSGSSGSSGGSGGSGGSAAGGLSPAAPAASAAAASPFVPPPPSYSPPPSLSPQPARDETPTQRGGSVEGWTCVACTLEHQAPEEQAFLQCAVCAAPRDMPPAHGSPPAPAAAHQQHSALRPAKRGRSSDIRSFF